MQQNSLPPGVSKTTLPNGLRVLTEFMPSVRSVSVGAWLCYGSRHESDADSGITHFTEHMVFKGTERYTAREIARAVDGLGGHLDAFTSKETTGFTAKVLDEHWPKALDILSSMVQCPTFPAEEIEREKGVVLEELKIDEDNPEYLLGKIFARHFWKNHGMGRPVIGSQETIRAFGRDQLLRFFGDTFRAPNFVVTAAGHVQHGPFVEAVERVLEALPPGPPPSAPTRPITQADIVLHAKPSLEQAHLNLGVSTFGTGDPRRFAGFVLSTLLGGGFSSRLFQKIREEAGLAYSVYADLGLYSDTGCLSVSAGTSVEAVPAVLEYALHELRDLRENLAPNEEIRRAKNQLKGSMLLALESPGSRMANLARQEMLYGNIRSLDEVRIQVEAVTAQQVQDLAVEWFQPERMALSVVGNLGDLRIERAQLAA